MVVDTDSSRACWRINGVVLPLLSKTDTYAEAIVLTKYELCPSDGSQPVTVPEGIRFWQMVENMLAWGTGGLLMLNLL